MTVCVWVQFESVVCSVMIHFSVFAMETHVTPLCYVKDADISSRAESISWPFPLLFAFSIVYCPRVVIGGILKEALLLLSSVEMPSYE